MNTLRDGTIRVCREVRAIIPGGEAPFFFFFWILQEKNLPIIIYPNIRYSFRKTFHVLLLLLLPPPTFPPHLPLIGSEIERVYRKNKTEGGRREEKRMKEEKIAEREGRRGMEAVCSSPGILANYSADSAPSLKINATLSASSRPAIWCNERARRRSRGME